MPVRLSSDNTVAGGALGLCASVARSVRQRGCRSDVGPVHGECPCERERQRRVAPRPDPRSCRSNTGPGAPPRDRPRAPQRRCRSEARPEGLSLPGWTSRVVAPRLDRCPRQPRADTTRAARKAALERARGGSTRACRAPSVSGMSRDTGVTDVPRTRVSGMSCDMGAGCARGETAIRRRGGTRREARELARGAS